MNFKSAWRMALRDLRSGDLTLLIAALVLAVAALSSVNLLAERLTGALQRDAAQLLGGDAVVVSDQPAPAMIQDLVQRLRLKSAEILTFPTMVRADTRTKLVAIKAVNPGYPLRGQLKIDHDLATTQVPARGEAWVEASLLASLGVQLGERVALGNTTVRLTHILRSEPDRGFSFLNFAPRVLINAQDLPATELIQPASRVTYRLAVVGAPPQIAQFKQAVQAALPTLKGIRLDTLESGRPETRQVLETSNKFLRLVALLCALVCAVAVAMAARAFAHKRIQECALRRVLGQTHPSIVKTFAQEFFTIGLLASLLGIAAGFALQYVFEAALTPFLQTHLPPPSNWTSLIGLGLGVGMSLLFGFGLPPILQLAKTSPLNALRHDLGRPAAKPILTSLCALLGFALLILLAAASQDSALGAIVTGGFAAALLLFIALAYAMLRVLEASSRYVGRTMTWKIACRQLFAYRWQTALQVASLAIGLSALLVLSLMRNHLLSDWQQARLPDAANRMVINIMPDQAEAFKAQLAQSHPAVFDWYPMIRGRLIEVNHHPIQAQDYSDERAKRLIEREFNLSHSAKLPEYNRIVSGTWTAQEAGAVSIEEGLANTLGLKLGDTLRFDIAGQSVDVRVTSVRQVNWQSMRANFFVLFPAAAMPPEFPVTYLAAYRIRPHLPDAAATKSSDDLQAYALDNALVAQFPNITIIDLEQSLQELAKVIDQVASAIQSLFLFSLAAGLIVLVVTLRQSQEHMARDFALMRALGATRKQLRQIQALQLTLIGALAGLASAVAAQALAWGLAKWVFQFDWAISFSLPLWGILGGSALSLTVGWWPLRKILDQPVMLSLRNTQ